jgi:hypothetical protein
MDSVSEKVELMDAARETLVREVDGAREQALSLASFKSRKNSAQERQACITRLLGRGLWIASFSLTLQE